MTRRTALARAGLLLCGLALVLARLLGAAGLPTPAAGPRPDARRAQPDVSPGDLPAILASRQLLAARHLAVGDVVSLSTDPSGSSPRRFRIAGVYEPMADPIRLNSERYEVRLHLPDLLDLTADAAGPLRAEAVSAINVGLTDPDDAAAFARDLAARVPTIAARSSRDAGGGNPFEVLGRFHSAIAVLTVTTSAVFLLALMVLLADERREVIGALRLMGCTRARVLAQVLLEGAAIAGAGAAFGVLLAAASQGAFNGYFQWKYDTALVFVRVTPEIAWQSVAMALPLGVAANLLASWALVRSDTLGLVRR